MGEGTVREERIESSGGVGIHVRSWRPESRPKAIVVICHGVNSHGGQHAWTAERLRERGFAVWALDLRGRGKSEGRRFYVDHVDEYVADVDATVRRAKAADPGLPLFLLGHSAGGVVSCTYALDHPGELAGLVCESFAFRVPAPKAVLALVKALSGLFPNLPALKLKMRDFTRDPAALAALEADPLTKDEAQPAKTVAALVRADERLERDFPRMTLPLLILHGREDKATVPAGSQLFYDTAGSTDKTLRLYDGMVHDLLNDVGKEAVFAEIAGWIEGRLPGGGHR
jgi:alpha-beta hydrolase superfamily lysophospholipase